MKKIILIPDSFKGTMSSMEICAIMKETLLNTYPQAEVISIPVADGGEGSVDSFIQAMGGEKIYINVQGPYGKLMKSFYGIVDKNIAIIEMAACAGLPLVGEEKNPMETTTYGVGEMILDAAQRGCKKIIVGLGGSATNDAGTGAAAACGIQFFDERGDSFIPVGGTLEKVAGIDMSKKSKELSDVEIVTMCDIDNPLFGVSGAAYIFGPQKGADEEMVEKLDQGLRNIAQVIKRDLGIDIDTLTGAGAAGGMGAGMVAFFNSNLQMGIETVLETVEFDKQAVDADLVFSGEGKIDGQSLRGKVVIGVARHTKKLGIPLIAVVGDIGDDIDAAYEQGVSGIFSINRVAVDFKVAKERSKDDLKLTMQNLLYFIHEMKL